MAGLLALVRITHYPYHQGAQLEAVRPLRAPSTACFREVLVSAPTEVTIALLVRGDPPAELLLGWKKRGVGQSLFTGIGGRVEPGETPLGAAAREVQEEIAVQVSSADLRPVGTLHFNFPARPEWSEVAHVFLARRWKGEPRETEEIRPSWFAISDIPYDRMWHDYSFWLPCAIQGQYVSGAFTYGSDNKTVAAFQLGTE